MGLEEVIDLEEFLTRSPVLRRRVVAWSELRFLVSVSWAPDWVSDPASFLPPEMEVDVFGVDFAFLGSGVGAGVGISAACVVWFSASVTTGRVPAANFSKRGVYKKKYMNPSVIASVAMNELMNTIENDRNLVDGMGPSRLLRP